MRLQRGPPVLNIWFHPLPVYPGEKGWNKKAKNILHAGILRGVCECGGYGGDARGFYRALVYEGGPDSAATLRPLFKKSKASPKFARFASKYFDLATSPEMAKLFAGFEPSPSKRATK